MAGLKNSCDGFAYANIYAIDNSKEGGYVLNITNTVAILTLYKVTGHLVFELTRCSR